MNEHQRKLVFSHQSDEYITPKWLFDKLNECYHFTLDPCANIINHQCDKYYTMEDDGLSKSWVNENVFINPPYSNIKAWIKKAHDESYISRKNYYVLLVPSRTDTRWFHDYVLDCAIEVNFIRGRLKFDNPMFPSWRADGSHKVSPAPFPSMVIVYNADIYHWNCCTDIGSIEKDKV
jgi:site-specific DNA-methyltransferase (adenine-specific)